MKISIRTTHAFAELTVDEIETTIFASDKKEVNEMIENLLSVAQDLTKYSNKELKEYIHELDY